MLAAEEDKQIQKKSEVCACCVARCVARLHYPAAHTALRGSLPSCFALRAQDSTEDKENGGPDEASDYEKGRQARMQENQAFLSLLDKVKIGKTVHIPHTVFPDEPEPEGGFWIGQTVATRLGGLGDIGIQVPGDDEIFTRPRAEVAQWIVE